MAWINSHYPDVYLLLATIYNARIMSIIKYDILVCGEIYSKGINRLVTIESYGLKQYNLKINIFIQLFVPTN